MLQGNTREHCKDMQLWRWMMILEKSKLTKTQLVGLCSIFCFHLYWSVLAANPPPTTSGTRVLVGSQPRIHHHFIPTRQGQTSKGEKINKDLFYDKLLFCVFKVVQKLTCLLVYNPFLHTMPFCTNYAWAGSVCIALTPPLQHCWIFCHALHSKCWFHSILYAGNPNPIKTMLQMYLIQHQLCKSTFVKIDVTIFFGQ